MTPRRIRCGHEGDHGQHCRLPKQHDGKHRDRYGNEWVARGWGVLYVEGFDPETSPRDRRPR